MRIMSHEMIDTPAADAGTDRDPVCGNEAQAL